MINQGWVRAGLVLSLVLQLGCRMELSEMQDRKNPDPVTPTSLPSVTPQPTAAGGVTALNFSKIPYSADDLNAPGRGMEVWYNTNQIPIPGGVNRLDKYIRFCWSEFEKAGEGRYDWTSFNREINNAIDNGQKFSFGIMTEYPTSSDPVVVSFDGAVACYPQYVHAKMQAESVKDWKLDGYWVPNWNSEGYLSSFEKFMIGLSQHIQTTSYKGVVYKNVVNRIDVRGYGDWGEWHTYTTTGKEPIPRASARSLIRIIDAHVNAFPNHSLQAMVSGYRGVGFNSYESDTIPVEAAYHLLTAKNNMGPIGWRWDSIGNTSPWYAEYLENNPLVYNGLAFKTAIMERWKTAPVGGEGPGGEFGNGVQGYSQLESQIRRYRISFLGNGNYGIVPAASVIISASKLMGYRLVLNGGHFTPATDSNRRISIMLQHQNIGTAPTYEHWDVMFELRNTTSSVVVWSGKSSMVLRNFLPENSSRTVTDSFTIPTSVAAGSYSLHVVIRDPNGYRKPLPLAIQGRASDGAYFLGTVRVQ